MVEASTREGSAADAIDGVVPRQIVEPDTASGLAAALQRASRDRLVTVLRGGGTKLGWGRRPPPIDLLVSTARLNSLLVHRHGDLTATAHAGVTLAQLNRELARHGQWLPVDSAFDGATIGGIVATNDSGPLRHRHGTPRDLLIGVTLAMPDGRLVKAGGHVVKNVAGYDLGKLVSGSFGSLAAIVDATFKLFRCLRRRPRSIRAIEASNMAATPRRSPHHSSSRRVRRAGALSTLVGSPRSARRQGAGRVRAAYARRRCRRS
jgi:glycolate oxidase FAD binding subunit